MFNEEKPRISHFTNDSMLSKISLQTNSESPYHWYSEYRKNHQIDEDGFSLKATW